MIKLLGIFLFMTTLLFATVNVNRANSAQLQTLHGIGPTKAQEIIKYRKSHGSFKNADELVNVSGIGPKTLQKMKSQVTVR